MQLKTKNFRGNRFLLFGTLLISALQVSAQVKSSHDGFYSLDSVFYQLTGKDSFKYCVNCYSPDSLRTYTSGVWIYLREHAPNTWENNKFSQTTDSNNAISVRANVVKANTIWVRIYNDTGYIDQHHLVYLGNWRPKAPQVISVFLDSSDFIGPNGFYGPGAGLQTNLGYIGNYRLKLEKSCSYQIFGGTNFQLEAAQTGGIQISAFNSAEFPDKGLQLNAGGTSSNAKFLALGKSLANLLGTDIKALRLRVGGSNHHSSILANEIATDIIRPDIGGAHSIPICVFINGTFWTYALAEEGLGQNHISKILKTLADQVVCVKAGPIINTASFKKRGLSLTAQGNSVYSVGGFSNHDMIVYACNDVVQLELDTTNKAYNPLNFEALCNAVNNGSDSLLASIIDRDALYRYALSIWFFQNPDSWGEHLTMAKAGAMPWKLFSEHYDWKPRSAATNDWDKYFANYPLQTRNTAKKSLPWQAAKRMFGFDRDYFCLVFEDELNTTYLADRIVPIAEKKIASLRPTINECSRAWYPNGWIDSTSWESAVSAIVPFLAERPAGIASTLPKIFLSGADTLLTLKNMNQVIVKFDSVVGKGVTVKLNSIEVSGNFSGKYYPKPDLRISLTYDSTKYSFVKWLEYPNAPVTFRLSANHQITLTPVLKLRKT